MPFDLKWQCCLGPIAKYIHFRKKSVFYEFDDKHILFLIVLDLSPSIMISTPWSISLVNGGVARKSCILT